MGSFGVVIFSPNFPDIAVPPFLILLFWEGGNYMFRDL